MAELLLAAMQWLFLGFVVASVLVGVMGMVLLAFWLIDRAIGRFIDLRAFIEVARHARQQDRNVWLKRSARRHED